MVSVTVDYVLSSLQVDGLLIMVARGLRNGMVACYNYLLSLLSSTAHARIYRMCSAGVNSPGRMRNMFLVTRSVP